MMRALYTAATGMISEQTNVDTIANNLSNVNTTGFKSARTEFKSLLYQNLQAETTSANGETKPVGAQVGLGTRVAATTTMYTQGALNPSENPTDFAIEGDGFFAVRSQDGKVYYTRNGNFSWALDAQGRTMLCANDGSPVLDRGGNPILVPNGVHAEAMTFTQEGQIGYRDNTGNVQLTNTYMAVYQFNNPSGLEKISGGRLAVTGASGQPMLEGTTAGLSRSKVCQNFLEASNVQVADEMVNLIIAQRAYELNSKAIQTSDSMLDTANNLKR